MSASKECPVCGNSARNLANRVGQWKCAVCENIWTPDTAPKPAPAPVAETEPVAQVEQQAPVRQRENAALQIRTLHAHLKYRLPAGDDAVLRELALDIHQALADAVAGRRVQVGIDALGSELL